MEHFSRDCSGAGDLLAWLDSARVAAALRAAKSVLVQVWAARPDDGQAQQVLATLAAQLPGAVVVGATTVGEGVEGRTLTDTIAVGITAFDDTTLQCIALPGTPGQEADCGRSLAAAAAGGGGGMRAALLLATPLSLDLARLLAGLAEQPLPCPVFGGGAGDTAQNRQGLVWAGTAAIKAGAVLVVLRGEALRVTVHSYLGWQPLSRDMRVTATDAMEVLRIDDRPAAQVYRRYLGIDDTARFVLDAQEFPLLMERGGRLLARVPVAVTPREGLQFVADVPEGALVRIGYADPATLSRDAAQVRAALRPFDPQAIFVYTGGCRRFLMQAGADQETLPFEAITPAFGCYTCGELLGTGGSVDLLNSTMLAVGLSERPPAPEPPAIPAPPGPAATGDPYAEQHRRIVSRLVHFVDRVTQELAEANAEVLRLSRTDRLTAVHNRASLDTLLAEALHRQSRYREGLAVVLIDLDHFKRINDRHGHVVGDRALAHAARVFAGACRRSDMLGRWGGEEFLLIVPRSDAAGAAQLAGKLRAALAGSALPAVGRLTASFGVTAWAEGDDATTLVARADAALCEAKGRGRNRVDVAR